MSIESLKKALSANQTLDDALLEAPAAVPADTPLSDLISWSPGRRAQCRWCAKEHNYLGIISKAMLLQALDKEGSANE